MNFISSGQKCPLANEYYQFNTGWIIKDTIEYSIFKGLRDTTYSKTFSKGKGIIFRYQAAYDCPEIFDEEQTDVLTWSIPDTATSFKIILKKDNYKLANFDYILVQFGYNRSQRILLSAEGEITGTKENEMWKISGSLEILVSNKGSEYKSTREVQFSKTFTLSVFTGKKKEKKYADNSPFYYAK